MSSLERMFESFMEFRNTNLYMRSNYKCEDKEYLEKDTKFQHYIFPLFIQSESESGHQTIIQVKLIL